MFTQPYRLETEAGCVYEYWVVNDTEPADASEVAALNIKQMRFQQELFDKTQELRRNFVGDEFEAYTDSPDLDVCKIMLNMEIVSAQDFDLDHVYVQYLLDIPEGWATGDAPQLWANTQVSKVRHVKNEEGKTTTRAIAHFGLPIDLTLWQTADVKNGSDFKEEEARGVTRMPCILLQVNSYDMWDRNRTQGYAHMNLPLTPGCSTHTVQTWRPALTQIGRMRSFFIGGTPELKDLTFAGVPTTQQSSTLSRWTPLHRLRRLSRTSQPHPHLQDCTRCPRVQHVTRLGSMCLFLSFIDTPRSPRSRQVWVQFRVCWQRYASMPLHRARPQAHDAKQGKEQQGGREAQDHCRKRFGGYKVRGHKQQRASKSRPSLQGQVDRPVHLWLCDDSTGNRYQNNKRLQSSPPANVSIVPVPQLPSFVAFCELVGGQPLAAMN